MRFDESRKATTTIDAARDDARMANRGGFSFLLVHGITWTVASVLSFMLPTETAALVYLFQGLLAFPASLALERLLGYRFVKADENPLIGLFVMIAMIQGLALPASIIAFNLDPLYVPAVFAATSGGHLLPYSWLHRTPAYVAVAIIAALGPFVVLLFAGADSSFHYSGFLIGAVMIVASLYIRAQVERDARTVASSGG